MYPRRNEVLFSLALLTAAASGCGGNDTSTSPTTSFPADPYLVVTSEQGKLAIEVRTGPSQPPGRGETDMQLTVRDAAGALVEGLDIQATPWMPAMGHGTSVTPMVSGGEAGTYFLRNVSMYMAGVWEVRTTFSGSVMDSATPVFEVR
jgi:YtkA-like